MPKQLIQRICLQIVVVVLSALIVLSICYVGKLYMLPLVAEKKTDLLRNKAEPKYEGLYTELGVMQETVMSADMNSPEMARYLVREVEETDTDMTLMRQTSVLKPKDKIRDRNMRGYLTLNILCKDSESKWGSFRVYDDKGSVDLAKMLGELEKSQTTKKPLKVIVPSNPAWREGVYELIFWGLNGNTEPTEEERKHLKARADKLYALMHTREMRSYAGKWGQSGYDGDILILPSGVRDFYTGSVYSLLAPVQIRKAVTVTLQGSRRVDYIADDLRRIGIYTYEPIFGVLVGVKNIEI